MTEPLPTPTLRSYSPATARHSREENFFARRRHEYLLPSTIKANESNALTLSFELPDLTRTTLPFALLSAAHCKQFCYKDTVIYKNGPRSLAVDDAILRAVYRAWYPQRDRVRDLDQNSFFAKYMCVSPPQSLAEVVRWHAVLCAHVAGLSVELRHQPVPAGYGPAQIRRLADAQGELAYEITATFPCVFLVVDDVEWKRKGVLMVCRDSSAAAALGAEASEFRRREEGADVGDTGAVVFRLGWNRRCF